MTSDPDFKVMIFLEVEYQKDGVKDEVAIEQEESIANILNGTMFGDLN